MGSDGSHSRRVFLSRAAPAAAKYPAQDNLDAMNEWPGDPIAAGHNLWPPIQL